MFDLSDLYQEVILDHGKRPRNHRVIEGAGSAEGYNPLCGDRVTVYVKLDGETIEDISFVGKACAICTASASMMTQEARGKPKSEIASTSEAFVQMVTHEAEPPATLGKLIALAGVRRYPMRVKCATLPWHTLRAAIDDQGNDQVSTE
ncbi:MAG: Fe-S cluster assembly sulfur transfer protein SufU [Planctomycetota bacterium]|jgi:nitrogen fixation NifU-like protein